MIVKWSLGEGDLFSVRGRSADEGVVGDAGVVFSGLAFEVQVNVWIVIVYGGVWTRKSCSSLVELEPAELPIESIKMSLYLPRRVV